MYQFFHSLAKIFVTLDACYEELSLLTMQQHLYDVFTLEKCVTLYHLQAIASLFKQLLRLSYKTLF